MKENFKDLLFILGIIVFISGFVILEVLPPGKKKYCGTIRYKIEVESYGKYQTRAEPLFVIRFDDPSIDYEINPTWADYMDHEQGDRICYTLYTYKVEEDAPDPMVLPIILIVVGLGLILVQGILSI